MGDAIEHDFGFAIRTYAQLHAYLMCKGRKATDVNVYLGATSQICIEMYKEKKGQKNPILVMANQGVARWKFLLSQVHFLKTESLFDT